MRDRVAVQHHPRAPSRISFDDLLSAVWWRVYVESGCETDVRLVSSSLRVSAWRSRFQFVQARTQNFHGHSRFLCCWFILALYDDAARKCVMPHRGFHFWFTFWPPARRPRKCDAHLFGFDDDVDSIVNFRNDEDEANDVWRRAADRRRNANQAVHRPLSVRESKAFSPSTAQRAISVQRFAGVRSIRWARNPCARPAEIHRSNISPNPLIHAAGAGFDRHDGVQPSFSPERSVSVSSSET